MTGTRLKKPSAANSTSPKPPEALVFFLDRSLVRHTVADALRAAGGNVIVHDDRFPQTTTDPEWLKEAGANQWVVLTRDERIRYRAAEKQALRRAQVRAFVLTARGGLTAQDWAAIFLKAMPKMQRLARTQPPPFIATMVPVAGRYGFTTAGGVGSRGTWQASAVRLGRKGSERRSDGFSKPLALDSSRMSTREILLEVAQKLPTEATLADAIY